MALFVAGVNPHRPEFHRLAAALAAPEARRGLLAAVASHRSLAEGLLLADDGRVELYAVAEEGTDAYDIAAGLLAAVPAVPDASGALYFAEGTDAAQHLFAALCEVDEFAREGEGRALAERFGGALAEARAAGCSGEALGQLSAAASALAASLAAEAGGSSPPALAETAVELARRVFGHLEKRSVLVVGAGGLASVLVEALTQAGVDDLTLLGAPGQPVPPQLAGARTVTPEALDVVAGNADILVAGAPVEGATLNRRLMKGAARLRRGRPSLLIDASAEGSLVEPKVSAIDSVFLYTADDLAAITREAPWAVHGAAASREKLLADAVRAFEFSQPNLFS